MSGNRQTSRTRPGLHVCTSLNLRSTKARTPLLIHPDRLFNVSIDKKHKLHIQGRVSMLNAKTHRSRTVRPLGPLPARLEFKLEGCSIHWLFVWKVALDHDRTEQNVSLTYTHCPEGYGNKLLQSGGCFDAASRESQLASCRKTNSKQPTPKVTSKATCQDCTRGGCAACVH